MREGEELEEEGLEGEGEEGCQQRNDSSRLGLVGENGEVDHALEAGAHHDEDESPELLVGKPDQDYQGGNGQQTEQVEAASEPKEVGEKVKPAIVEGTVLGALPVDDQPDAQTDEEEGIAVDFGLGGIEPVGVGHGQGQGAQGGTGLAADIAAVAKGTQGRPAQGAAAQGHAAQIDAPDAQGRGQGRHEVDAPGHFVEW